MNVFSKSNEVFETLKTYIKKNSIYNPEVKKYSIKNSYPMVVFEEITNTLNSVSCDYNQRQEFRNLNYEINIYAIPINKINSDIICEELANLVIDVMQRYYRMEGGLDARFININSSNASQYTLHFSCKWDMERNYIYHD